MYSKIGSPTAEISGIVHFKSNAFDKTILKIYINSSIGKRYLLNVDRVASRTEDETGFHCVSKSSCLTLEKSLSEPNLFRDFLLVFSWEIDEMIKLCAY